MDLVQFIYAFLIFPVGYVWLKNFIYILLRNEIGVNLSLGEWFTIDTVFTIFFMYFYAFGIMHALTKTFSLHLNRDPLYDIFDNSKYFHEFLSHIGMYAGIILLITLLSLVNSAFPIIIENKKSTMYLVIGAAWATGFLGYIGMFFSTDKGFQYSKYKRIMKLIFGFCFLVQALFYFFLHPSFTLQYSAFWFVFIALTSIIVSMFVFNPTKRFGKILQRLPINGID